MARTLTDSELATEMLSNPSVGQLVESIIDAWDIHQLREWVVSRQAAGYEVIGVGNSAIGCPLYHYAYEHMEGYANLSVLPSGVYIDWDDGNGAQLARIIDIGGAYDPFRQLMVDVDSRFDNHTAVAIATDPSDEDHIGLLDLIDKAIVVTERK